MYGGARVGLMGAVADGALAGGGEVVGVIPQGLADREVAHDGLTDLRVVGSMHERKALMTELSDGVVALPGGLGTLDELFESLTWAQLGLHGLERKPVGLLDTGAYWSPLLALVEHTVDEGFVGRDRLDHLLRVGDPATLLDLMAARA
ncbi:LOG family protein YvdD [Nocardioides aquaticus]|uniref:Cytokinin riboside 5'-monophosphate phosphoribohydrolase n=1 Tax=Nocardioides aquaticus TaxID=160826 RepID=A0ABX8EDY7_9ACTN|nr:LOG family protein YvdD [Nocardioides aquaticus]